MESGLIFKTGIELERGERGVRDVIGERREEA
jgi:hypothetical protein